MTRRTPRRTLKEVTRQVAAVMGLDLFEEAKLVWTFLYVCKTGGIGTTNLAVQTGLDEDVALEAIGVLKEQGIVHNKGGKWRARPYLRAKEEEVSSAPAAIREAAEVFLDKYQRARTRAGVPPLMQTKGALRCFEGLVEWLNENGVDGVAFLEWAVERTAFMKDKGIAFPAPNLVAGPWLRGEWMTTTTKTGGTPKHAGKAYSTAAGLRERLVAAGFDRARGFTKGDLRHIESWAMDMVAMPDDFPDPDPEFEPEILWFRDHLNGEGHVPTA